MARKGFSGLILGAIIGAVAALLWTPKRGSEWRDEIADKSGKFKDKAANVGANVGAKVNTTAGDATAGKSELFETIKEKGAEFASEAAGHFKDMKESAAQKIGEVKQEASGKAEVVSADVSDVANEIPNVTP